MRRVMTLLELAAIFVLAASAAQASSYSLPYYSGDAGFIEYNLFSSPLENGSNPTQLANWNNPHASKEGAIWINTGSGPVLEANAINMELWVNDIDAEWGPGGDNTGGTDGWLLEDRALLSDGGANNDMMSGNPGCFDVQGSELGVPGTFWDDYYNYGADSTFQMQLYIWTGTESTYTQAVQDGQYTATAIWNQNVAPAYYGSYGQMPQIPPGLSRMPAMIMTAVPEPSTLLLAAAGLVGLLAYAWRKRK